MGNTNKNRRRDSSGRFVRNANFNLTAEKEFRTQPVGEVAMRIDDGAVWNDVGNIGIYDSIATPLPPALKELIYGPTILVKHPSSPELEAAEDIVEEIDNELGTGNKSKSKRGFPVWLKVVFVIAGFFILKKMFENGK